MTEPAGTQALPGADDGPTTTDRVLAWLGAGDDVRPVVADVVAGVNDLIQSWTDQPRDPVTLARIPWADVTWPPRIVHGATMLAARQYQRRDSPNGVLPFGPDGAVFIQRSDPDVALFLSLGAYARPGVG